MRIYFLNLSFYLRYLAVNSLGVVAFSATVSVGPEMYRGLVKAISMSPGESAVSIFFPQAFQKVKAVPSRHLYIGDEHIEGGLAHQIKRFDNTGGEAEVPVDPFLNEDAIDTF
jgi:hypothetical protein